MPDSEKANELISARLPEPKEDTAKPTDQKTAKPFDAFRMIGTEPPKRRFMDPGFPF